MNVGERIKELRKGLQMTQVQLAEEISRNMKDGEKFSRQAVSLWEQGNAEPKSGSLQAVALALGVSADYLLNGPSESDTSVPSGYIRIPFYDNFNACRHRAGKTSTDDVRTMDLPEAIFDEPHSDEKGKEIFAVKVSGQSMDPSGVRDGAYIFVNPAAEISDGDVVLVELDGNFMLKYLFLDRRGGGGELHSASAGYPIKRYTKEDVDDGSFKIIGKSVLVASRVRGRKL